MHRKKKKRIEGFSDFWTLTWVSWRWLNIIALLCELSCNWSFVSPDGAVSSLTPDVTWGSIRAGLASCVWSMWSYNKSPIAASIPSCCWTIWNHLQVWFWAVRSSLSASVFALLQHLTLLPMLSLQEDASDLSWCKTPFFVKRGSYILNSPGWL